MLLLLQIVCMGGSFFYFYTCGMSISQLILFYMAWALILLCCILTDWHQRSVYFKKIEKTLELLDQPYLLSEVMPRSFRLEDKRYHEFLRISNKGMIDEVHRLEKERAEYQEFIENWIHEVKHPITTMQLICGNLLHGKSSQNIIKDSIRSLQAQLSKVENDVETALFYARSDTVYQDYMIREISLKEIVSETINRNAPYLKHCGVCVEPGLTEEMVYCDEKWLEFILGQLLINAGKYRKEEGCVVRIFTQKENSGVRLTVEDNGIGIPECELGRIFDKGFTGSNGRSIRQSTGIGLYLCKKLCRKLGISIDAQSEEGIYTRIRLFFPDGSSYFSRQTKGKLSKM